MLETTDRRLLHDALRPPAGYVLDRAIGTTFSLDLLALLTAPLAFTFFDWVTEDGGRQAHPLALLEALRRHASAISLFCQAGQIAVPKSHRQLYAFLEESVVEVSAPLETGVFHPKVWLLRYTAPGAAPSHYRLLCLSRNLTFDRSWDTALILEGRPIHGQDPEKAEALRQQNEPLRTFFAALPTLAVRPASKRIRADVASLCADMEHIVFEPPHGFDSLTFWPLGIADKPRLPFSGRIDRLLIVSPFVSENGLKYLTECASNSGASILVSRAEELAYASRAALARFAGVYALNPDAYMEESDEGTPADSLSGLHAKLYVADAGWNARVWTGSANATSAALRNNVEFLVEMTGKKSLCGIDQILGCAGAAGKDGLFSLLNLYDIDSRRSQKNPVDKQFDDLSTQVRRTLARASLVARVVPASESHPPDTFRITLTYSEDIDDASRQATLESLLPLFAQMTGGAAPVLTCWPISRPESGAVRFSPSPVHGAQSLAEFEPLATESLTTFFAFRLTAQVVVAERAGTVRKTCDFVLNIPLLNAPEDRQQRVLRSLLNNRQEVLRFLRLLLSGDGEDPGHLLGGLDNQGDVAQEPTVGTAGGVPLDAPLLETMMQALHDAPEKLGDIQRLLRDLTDNHPEGTDLLPEGFWDIWEPIRAVYQAAAAQNPEREIRRGR